MKTIVVAAKAGSDQPWVADAAAELAQQTGAEAKVVSADGVDLEALSPLPRGEYAQRARESADAVARRVREAGVQATAEVRQGRPVRAVLLYAEEVEADLILVGASSRGKMARRVFGDVTLELVQRSRRPVFVVSRPDQEG